MIGRDMFVGSDPFIVGMAAMVAFMAVCGGFFAIAVLIGKLLKKLGVWVK